MKVLLTGGAGFIGIHTAVELCSAGHDPIILDDFSNSCPEAVRRAEELVGRELPLYRGDAGDAELLDRIFSENKVDAVIHFAGYKAVGESVQKPLDYYRNNIDSAVQVLAAMERAGVDNFIFSSSATVYGSSGTSPLSEEVGRGSCSNPYGWTKWMIEQIATDAAVARDSLSVVLLRYFNPIGAHPSGRIGEMPNGIPNNLMPYITQVAVGKRERLSVFGDDYDTPDGTCIRDYIHVVDLARGHVCALEYCAAHKGTEIFNLGTGKGYSVLDVVHAFEQASGAPLPYVIAPRRAGDLPTLYSDPSKAERVLGWHAEYGIADMCRDGWNWQHNNPEGYTG